MLFNDFFKKGFISSLLAFLLSSPLHAEPEVLGWLENAYLEPYTVKIRAKLDTGAKTSSIYAINVEPFETDGSLWVRFTLPKSALKSEGSKKDIHIEKPVIRETKIKEHIGDSVSRYVVEIEFCLNGKNYVTPVTLADRSNFNYPLLLGRNILKDNFLVDPGKTFTSTKSCLHID